MSDSDAMYRWRKWSPEKRDAILDSRRQRNRPWHSPPHIASKQTSIYMITAACYEHRPIIGHVEKRMMDLSNHLLEFLDTQTSKVYAWVVLPNHYHALIDTKDVLGLIAQIGKFHGRHSYEWNREDNTRGRQVWCKTSETAMKSRAHYWATLNYIHHNPIHHGYCRLWTEWPYSSAADYLTEVGRKQAEANWLQFPVGNYGANWDPPEF